MSDYESAPEQPREASRNAHPRHRPHHNALAAAIVAVASLAAAIVILVLTHDEAGIATAGAVATAGLALAGQLGAPGQ